MLISERSMLSLATRLRPAARVRSSSTISSSLLSVSPDPPMLVIIPDAISFRLAAAFCTLASLMPRLISSIFARASLTEMSLALMRSLYCDSALSNWFFTSSCSASTFLSLSAYSPASWRLPLLR